MKEIDYENKETLRAHVGRPLLTTSKAYFNSSEREPADVHVGILEEPRKDSFWIIGPYLQAKRTTQWPIAYTIFGVDYLPCRPHMENCVPDRRYDSDFKVYSFDSDAEGLAIVEKIKKLEDIPAIL